MKGNHLRNKIDKQGVLNLLARARKLEKVYAGERKRDPRNNYMPPPADEIALRLFERTNGVIVVNMTLNRRGNIHLQTIEGAVTTNGYVEHMNAGNSETYVLVGFEGTTIARFAKSVGEVLRERATSPDPVMREVMPPQNRAGRTLSRVTEYANS